MEILDKSFTLGFEEMYAIYHGWISDKHKMELLSISDGRSTDKIIRDALTGMSGEWGSYYYLSSYGVSCQKPECGVLPRDSGVWDKDLTVGPMLISKADRQFQAVVNRGEEGSISCKAQLLSQTNNIHDSEPSWTFQLDTWDRHGDPMLKDLDCNKLLVVSWIDDYWKGRKILYYNPRGAYVEGFRIQPQVTCFWWPDVSRFLRDPKKEDLIGKKTCLYFEDVKHLQSKIVANDDII